MSRKNNLKIFLHSLRSTPTRISSDGIRNARARKRAQVHTQYSARIHTQYWFVRRTDDLDIASQISNTPHFIFMKPASQDLAYIAQFKLGLYSPLLWQNHKISTIAP